MKGNGLCVGSVGTATAKGWILILLSEFVLCLVLFKSSVHFITLTILNGLFTSYTVRFSVQQFCVLPTHCIYVFCVDLRTNSHYFPIQH